jgi:hypothetical protein
MSKRLNLSSGIGSTRCGIFAAALPALLALMWLSTYARAQDSDIIADNYHAQTTSYTCAIASMEMQLDTPVITAANPFVNTLLLQGDGAYANLGAAPNNGAQSYIYYMVHSATTANLPVYNTAFNKANAQPGLTNNAYVYNNPYINPVPGGGSDLNSLQFGTNVLDASNTLVPGTLGLGNDAYASYNITNPYYASRTIANAMQDTGIPAVISINPNPFGIAYGQLGGQHAISVFGVNTTSAPGANNNYNINGFFVHDPWTGYAQNVAGVAAAYGLGIGENTYLSYGYTRPIPGAPQLALPNGGGQATVAPFTWFSYFVPSYGQAAPTVNQLYQTGVGYKFEVEPQGPEGLDTGGPNGTYYSLPALEPLLGSELDASGADGDIAGDLTADGLTSDFAGGSFDNSDSLLIKDPDDPSLQGDWLVPYDGGGGVNDVTGAVLIDEDTGLIDQATWFDANDPVTSMTLDQIDAMYQDQAADLVESDNNVPEPASVCLLTISAGGLLMRRRGLGKNDEC